MKLGDVIADRFVIERLASAGGMGVVYRALDRVEDRPVALKVLHHPAVGGERFAREAEVLALLDHPHIVKYIAHGESEGAGWLAIEWLDGFDLATRLVRGRLTINEAIGLVRRAAAALGAAHAHGIVHRDIKPSNLFLEHGDLDRVKVLDFGVARLQDGSGAHTRTGTTLGTPAYMAPEQARGDRDVGARVDVFALGCVLFECIAGRPVFVAEHVMAILAKVLLEEAPRLAEIEGSVSQPLDELVARMLSKAPEKRPATGAAVVAELDHLEVDAFDHTVDQPAPSLGVAEQRLLSVVLALARPTADRPASRASEPPRAPVSDEAANALAETLRPDEDGATVARVRTELASYGARVEKLADGSMVATLAGGGSATDQAARAARFSLAMRAMLPDIPMALATGRGWVVTDKFPVGDVIDRAARMLRDEVRAGAADPKPVSSSPAGLRLGWSAPISEADAGAISLGGGIQLGSGVAPRPVRLDEVTAGLLDVRFDVGGDASGLVLRAEREQMDATRTLLGKPTPFVGRERELGVLVGIFEECIAEPVSRAVLVTGAAGVGKSRLRYEFLRRIRERPERVEVWLARGDPMSAGAPFAMIAPALRRASGIYDGEPLGVRRQKLRARLGRSVPPDDLARVAEFLGELIGAPFPDEESVQLRAARQDAVLLGDRMRRAWETFLLAETRTQPLVIVLEDFHWGDLPSIQFLDAALRALEARPLLVIALARPEVRDLFPRLWEDRAIYELRLADLTKKASEKLVRAVLPAASTAVVGRVVSQASGNAFYLEELVRAVAEGKDEKLPETVLAMIEARLGGLSTDTRRVLRAASVFGQVLWRGGVAALIGGDERVHLIAKLDELVELEILARRGESRFPGQTEYVFRQSLVRETAYAMLTEQDRTLGHDLAAQWLERAGETDALVLAEHCERGGKTERAAELYLRAAVQARDANDFGRALASAERGAACGAKGETLGRLRLVQADVHLWRNESDAMVCAGEEALALFAEGSKAHGEALIELALAYAALGNVAHLERVGEAMVKLDLGSGESVGTLGLSRVAIALVHAGKPDLADSLIDRITTSAAGSSSPSVLAQLHLAHSLRALRDGDATAYLEHTRATVEQNERAGNLRAACRARANLGDAYLELGAASDAVRELEVARGMAWDMDLAGVELFAMVNLGLALAYEGRLDEGRAVLHEVIARPDANNNGRILSGAGIYLALVECFANQFPAAEVAARAVLDDPRTMPPQQAFALAMLARAELGQLRRTEALATTERAIRILDELGRIDTGDAVVRLTHAEAAYAVGEVARARVCIDDARDRILARAELIREPAQRARFLAKIPENAATLARAREWSA